MYKYSTIAAVLASVVFSAVPAHAQSIEIGPRGIEVNPDMDRPLRRERLSERQAARIARGEGMREVDSVSRRRNVYVVRGADRDGDDMRVVIDRRTGEVLEAD